VGIWEKTTVGQLAVGDIVRWGGSSELRVRVDRITPRTLGDGTEVVDLHVHGPESRWTPGHGLATSRINRLGDQVTRIRPVCAARMGDNLRLRHA
jgi:hypothetical protein